MAGSIKGITIEIGGDVQPLNKALQDVNSKSKSLQGELGQVNRLLKLDPTNVTLVAQKQKLLTDAVDNTSKKLETLKEAEKQAQDQFQKGEISEEQYRALQREVVKTEQELGKYEAELRDVETQSKETADATGDIGKKASSASTETKKFSKEGVVQFAAVAAAATAIVTAVASVSKKIIESANAIAQYADDIATMANMYRISTDSLQEFAYAAELVDVDVEVFGKSLGKLTKSMGAAQLGTKQQVDAFDGLGVSIYDTNGQLRDSEDVFYDVIDALGKMENETQADVYASMILGRSFQDLNPLVIAGTDALKEYGREAHTMGLIMSGEQLDKINAYKDAMDKLRYQIKMAAVPFIEGLIPAMETTVKLISQKLASPSMQATLRKLGETIGNVIQKAAKALFDFIDFLEKNGDMVLAIVAAIGTAFAAWKISGVVMALKAALVALIPSLAGATAAQTGLNVAMSANPVGAIIAGISALVVVLGGFIATAMKADEETQRLTEASDNLIDSMKQGAVDYIETTASIEAQATVASDLVDKLDALNQKANLTSTEQAQMRQMVSQLNSIYPDLNVSIDEQTGKLSQNTTEIKKNISALRDQAKEQAKQERIAQLTKEVADAQLQLAENEALREEKLKGLNEEQRKAIELMSDWSFFFTGAPDEIREVINSVRDLDAADEGLNEQLKTSQETLNVYSTDEIINANSAAAQSADELAAAEANQVAVQQEATEEIQKLYESRVAAATDALNRINEGEETSVKEMIDTLNANATAIQDWTTNINILANSGLDQGFLQTLRDKGPEAGKQVKALVDYMKETGDKSFVDFNKAMMRATSAGVDSISGIMLSDDAVSIGSQFISANAAGTRENLELRAAASNQVVDTKTAMKAAILQSNFRQLGVDIIGDLISGLNEKKEALVDAAKAIAESLKAALTIRGNITATARGRVASIDVGWYAKGGVFYAPSVIGVGEAGTEVVSPLSTLENIITNSIQRTINNAPEIHIQLNVRELNKAQTDYFVDTVSRRLTAGV